MKINSDEWPDEKTYKKFLKNRSHAIKHISRKSHKTYEERKAYNKRYIKMCPVCRKVRHLTETHDRKWMCQQCFLNTLESK